MKTIQINNQNNWDFPWNDELKKCLHKNGNQTSVGEHLLLETAEFKVWSILLPQGKSLPFHKHNKPYFYTAVNAGKSRSFYADGKVLETTYEKGDIKYFNELSKENYFIHNLENIGQTTLKFTTVEFKK